MQIPGSRGVFATMDVGERPCRQCPASHRVQLSQSMPDEVYRSIHMKRPLNDNSLQSCFFLSLCRRYSLALVSVERFAHYRLDGSHLIVGQLREFALRPLAAQPAFVQADEPDEIFRRPCPASRPCS